MSAKLSKAPFVLLGLLTVLTVGGPLAIWQTMRGGQNPRWPPDRPIEWSVFVLTTGLFLAVMIACLAFGVVNWRRTLAEGAARRVPPGPVDDSFNSD